MGKKLILLLVIALIIICCYHLAADDNLILVNQWNPIPDDYSVELVPIPDGQSVSKDCYNALNKMLKDCKNAGYRPFVISGYRSVEVQKQLYENKVARVMAQGYGYEKAAQLAAMEVAVPGTSEHHTGLAVDIVDADYRTLDDTQAQRPTQMWLMEHCFEYGFILRYPTNKTVETGIIYEPWHYRYVGKAAAKEIMEFGISFEEYIDWK